MIVSGTVKLGKSGFALYEDILCTHPMFGPQSGKHGWTGLPFVFERVRLNNARREWFIPVAAKYQKAMYCIKPDAIEIPKRGYFKVSPDFS